MLLGTNRRYKYFLNLMFSCDKMESREKDNSERQEFKVTRREFMLGVVAPILVAPGSILRQERDKIEEYIRQSSKNIPSGLRASVAKRGENMSNIFTPKIKIGINSHSNEAVLERVAKVTPNPSTVSLGNVVLGQNNEVELALVNNGPTSITIASFAISGSPQFAVTGQKGSFAVNSEALYWVTFTPTQLGAAPSSSLNITSPSTVPTVTKIPVTGTGVTEAYEVNLTWDAPVSSPDPVAGYNVYRAPAGNTSYQQINQNVIPASTTDYVDTAVQNGQTYDYIVESVDASGTTSAPSNMASVPVP
jgi:hypothetical protein